MGLPVWVISNAHSSNSNKPSNWPHQIRMTRNRALWLQDAGLVEYKLGDLDVARRYEEQALQTFTWPLARPRPDRRRRNQSRPVVV